MCCQIGTAYPLGNSGKEKKDDWVTISNPLFLLTISDGILGVRLECLCVLGVSASSGK